MQNEIAAAVGGLDIGEHVASEDAGRTMVINGKEVQVVSRRGAKKERKKNPWNAR